MVYRGKPSKACAPCRKRKLHCDLRLEGCSACRRADRLCTGYRDTEGLRVQDETSVVQRKVREQHSKPASATINSLDLDLCHQAKDVFYHNYVLGEAKSFDFLQLYYSLNDQHLVTSIDAVSLAYLSYQNQSVRAREEAREKYVLALNQIRVALRDPVRATSDATLLSILLLDLYEKINSSEPQTDRAWAAHLNGAVSLVKLRGAEQFRDPRALRLLARLSTNLLITCVASDKPVLPEVVYLRDAIAGKFMASSDPKWQESDLMIKYSHFKHRMKNGLLKNEDVLLMARELDAEFEAFAKTVADGWNYRIVVVQERSAHHFELVHHEYGNERMAQMWNVLRLTRILLNDAIYAYRDWSPSGLHPDEETFPESIADIAMRNVREIGADVCASVPQYICDLAHPLSGKVLDVDEKARFQRARAADATQHLPCYRLIFPLYVAAQSPAASESLKSYVIEQLRFMAGYHGIKNAMTIAEILDSGEQRDPWRVYALLGSYAFVC